MQLIKRWCCKHSNLDPRFLWERYDNKAWLLYKFYMLKFYRLIITCKTSFNCKKACESKTKLNLHIFYKHMTKLGLLRLPAHRAKVMEQYFPFFTPLWYLSSIYSYLSSTSEDKLITQQYMLQKSWNFNQSSCIK